MNFSKISHTITLVVLGLTCPSCWAQEEFVPKQFDWPQWQGPQRTAISQETGLLPSWPEGGPKLLWKVQGLGAGFSTPSVAAGRIFTMGNIGDKEYVLALREKDGKKLWATEVGPVRSGGGGHPGPRCTPTVDDERVYALGINGDLLCLNVDDGEVIWRKDLRKDFEGRVGGWGYSESPLIDGEKLICTPGNRKATLAALNKRTGETIWECPVPEGDRAAYSSVIKIEVDGLFQYVQLLSRGVVGVRAEDGKFLWRYNRPANGTANCSTPVSLSNTVFAASAYGTGGGLVELKRTGQSITATEKYFCDDMQNHHGGMVLVDGYLYGQGRGGLVCMNFETGEVLWYNNKAGRGSITFADGRLYYRNEGSRGTLFLIEPNPKEYIEHGRFDQPDRSNRRAWAHPVIANGRMYIADQDVLHCYDVKK